MLITISELSSVESLCTTGSSCYPKVDHSYETFHKLKTHKAKKAITLEYILLKHIYRHSSMTKPTAML